GDKSSAAGPPPFAPERTGTHRNTAQGWAISRKAVQAVARSHGDPPRALRGWYCAPPMIDWNLKGKRIAVPEMRELEVFSALLERRGAELLRCPLVTIYDSPHSAQVLAFAVRLVEGGFDDFVLITGEGLTRILGCIDKYDPPLRARFVESLGKLRTVTRGPKPARALRALGLKPGIEAGAPTTAGVIQALSTHDLAGRRVAVQLYGNDPNLTLMRFL